MVLVSCQSVCEHDSTSEKELSFQASYQAKDQQLVMIIGKIGNIGPVQTSYQYISDICISLPLISILISMEKTKDEANCLINELTYKHLQTQVELIKKVILGIGGHAKRRFPRCLLYEISRYVFKNPLILKQGLFVLSVQPTLQPTISHLLRRKSCSLVSFDGDQKHSAYLTLGAQWKAIKLSDHQNYNQILQKGTFFLTFLSSIKLHPLNWKQEQASENLLDHYDSQKKQRQKNKFHHLVSDSLEQNHSYLTEIYKYKKDKKIGELLIKSFVGLMTKNIVCVRIDRNYNTEPLGCEGKYLVIESSRYLALNFNRKGPQLRMSPLIQFANNNQWKLSTGQENSNFVLYKQAVYPLERGKGIIVTRNLTEIMQDDVWIEQDEKIFNFQEDKETQ